MKGVCLVVIARNESRCIGRCLRSFEAVVDDMLVLDTGSTDATPELARECGARVERFSWVDDFSAARNAALERSPGPWHLVADADEWLVGGADAVRPLASMPRDFVGMVTVQNTFDGNGGVGVKEAVLPRVLPEGTRYAGRVHEQPRSALPMRRLAIVLAHDGYRDEQRLRKQGRNEALLLAALAEQPEDAYLLYQLGKEQAARGALIEASQSYRRARLLSQPGSPYRQNLAVRLLGVLQGLKDWPAAIELIEAEMPLWGGTADFMLAAGNAMWNWAEAEPRRAGELLPMAEAAWLQCMHLADAGHDAERTLGLATRDAPLSLAALYERLGDLPRSRRFAALAAGAAR